MAYRHPQEILLATQSFIETSPEWEFSGRKLIAVDNVQFGKKQIEYRTRTRPHELGHWHTPGAPDAEQDVVRYNNLYVPVWETTYEFPYTNWDAVDEKYLRDCANDIVYEVVRAEHKVIVDGHTNPAGTYFDGLTGLTGGAGNTYVQTAGTWASGADPYMTFLEMRNMMYADAIQGPYIVGISEDYYGYLSIPDANGNVTIDLIRKGLPDIGEIIITPNTNASYPILMVKKDERYAKLMLIEDARVYEPYKSSPKEWIVQVNHSLAIKVATANSVCRGTGI
jgi:hypothetical protein